MKYKEYLEERELAKVEKGEKENIFKRFFKSLPLILKRVFNILVLIIKHSIRILAYLLDQLAEFIMFIISLLYHKIPNSKKETSLKKCIKIVMLALLCLSLLFIHMHKENNRLNDEIVNMSSSIENNNTIVEEKEEKVEENKNVVLESDKKVAQEKIEKAEKVEMFGTDSIKVKIGSVDPAYYSNKGYVRYKTKSGDIKVEIVSLYGIGEFSSSPKAGTRYVKNVTDYIKSIDKDFYEKYFSDVNAPGTTTFTTGWQDAASDEKDKFLKYQFQYLYINYVEPTMEELVDKYGIDENNDAIKEFVFSTSIQYGYKGTLVLFDKAGITKDITNKEIIQKVQDEKISSIGKYTYTNEYKYDKYDRASIKEEVETETEMFLKRL